MHIEQIFYSSRMADAFDGAALDDILSRSRHNNERRDVTGALVIDGDRIIQVLEGAPEVLQPLYDLIARDPRHADVTVLLRREVEARQFPHWSMAWIFEPLASAPEDAPAETLGMMAASLEEQGVA
jgi:hypothetical protein